MLHRKEFFGDHFAAIFDRASKAGCIIERTPNRDESVFNEALYAELRKVLASKLNQETCDELKGAAPTIRRDPCLVVPDRFRKPG